MRLSRHEWVWVRGRVEMRGMLILIAAVAADFTRYLLIRLDVDDEATRGEVVREVERRMREFLKS